MLLLLCPFSATASLPYSSAFLTSRILTISLLHPLIFHGKAEEVEEENLGQTFRLPNGEVELKWLTCDDQTLFEWEDHFSDVHEEESLYQKISFDESLEKEDKCLTLDTTMQQCSSYRPHYHEPFVHYTASYLNEGIMSGVKRVVFVGGGDSMLLHEVLKYQGLEIVLGLELDQKVTRNSFEHFKTQPHFDNPKVQWWFGDGAKSLTLLPRSYFGTFDMVLLDLSETVMSMSVTNGLDVFGAMKLLLSDTGILVKNDFGYFEKLSRVFDTCLQLLVQDVTYICDYELVLCGSDKLDLLNPSFHHMKGGEGTDQVETLVYQPIDDIDDHWKYVTDFSKYWGEPKHCNDTSREVNEEEEVAYAGILMVLEAEHVSFESLTNVKKVGEELETVVKDLGYRVMSTTTKDSTGSKDGVIVALAMEEGYILAETWPDVKYCKLDIHLWGNFERQEAIRANVLKVLGVKEGDWSSYRIVTFGIRGLDTRSNDLKTVGPDLAKIGQCEEVTEGSSKTATLNSSYNDEEALRPVIEAGYEDIISNMIGQTEDINVIVLCGVNGAPCHAKDSLEKQGFTKVVTLWSCPPEYARDMKTNKTMQSEAVQEWRQEMNTNASDFSLCGKKVDIALEEIEKKIEGINIIVIDALAPSQHVTACHQYWLQHWEDIYSPFLFLVPILDANDYHRNFFLNTRNNVCEPTPEYYSEIYLGDGDKIMSFGLIHEGVSILLQNLIAAERNLRSREEVKFAEIRKITTRGAANEQLVFEPETFSWDDYDQRPGLEQFYGQQPIGLQSVSQWSQDTDTRIALTYDSIEAAFKTVVGTLRGPVKKAFHKIGKGAVYIALFDEGQFIATWDGAANISLNIFTYDETTDHESVIATPFVNSLLDMNLMLRDEQPRGYGRVINTSDRINPDESPDCYDHYKLCTWLKDEGECDDESLWMIEHCAFSCSFCGVYTSSMASEL
jgi:spermidine synthase/S-adenosylmethionine/arginine decarboxylase-like enzyme